MFDRHCSACDRTQLIFPSQISAVTNTDHGILVSYTCWCGAEQTWLTGIARPRRRVRPRRGLSCPSRFRGPLAGPLSSARFPDAGSRAALAQSVERFTRNE